MDHKPVAKYSDYISDFRAPSKIDFARIMKSNSEEKPLKTDNGAVKPPEEGQTVAQTQRQ
jgi:hypothetical protein